MPQAQGKQNSRPEQLNEFELCEGGDITKRVGDKNYDGAKRIDAPGNE